MLSLYMNTLSVPFNRLIFTSWIKCGLMISRCEGEGCHIWRWLVGYGSIILVSASFMYITSVCTCKHVYQTSGSKNAAWKRASVLLSLHLFLIV
jgi:hypothetical protein